MQLILVPTQSMTLIKRWMISVAWWVLDKEKKKGVINPVCKRTYTAAMILIAALLFFKRQKGCIRWYKTVLSFPCLNLLIGLDESGRKYFKHVCINSCHWSTTSSSFLCISQLSYKILL